MLETDLASHWLRIPDPHLAKSTSCRFEDPKRWQIDAIVKPGVLQGVLGIPAVLVLFRKSGVISQQNHGQTTKGSVFFFELARL